MELEADQMDVAEEDEYEEIFVYVDFPDFDECNLLTDATELEISNIDGENPTCRINDLNFTGEHEINLGSQLFFEHLPNNTVQFVGQSVNVVKFKLASVGKAE